MADKNESFESKDFGWLVAMSFLFLALVAICFWREFSTEWGPYQQKFPQLLGQYGKGRGSARLPAGHQADLDSENRRDRPLRHLSSRLRLGVGASRHARRAADAASDELLDPKHQFAKFGCTPCHGGEGGATTARGRIRADVDGTIRCSRTQSRSNTDSRWAR